MGGFASDAACDAYLTSADLTKGAGTAYFNTTSNTLRYCDGSGWQTIPYAIVRPGSITETQLADRLIIQQFVTKAAAEEYTPNGGDAEYIRFFSDTGLAPSNGGRDWLGKKVGAEPSQDNWIRNRAGAGSYYERVPAAPRVLLPAFGNSA